MAVVLARIVRGADGSLYENNARNRPSVFDELAWLLEGCKRSVFLGARIGYMVGNLPYQKAHPKIKSAKADFFEFRAVTQMFGVVFL